MDRVSSPIFIFKPEFISRKLGFNELPTDAEYKEFGRWCVFKPTGVRRKVVKNGMRSYISNSVPVYPKENTYEAALKLSHTPTHQIKIKMTEPSEETEIDEQGNIVITKSVGGGYTEPVYKYGKYAPLIIKRYSGDKTRAAIVRAFLLGRTSIHIGNRLFDWCPCEMERKLPTDMFGLYELVMNEKIGRPSAIIWEILDEILDEVIK